MQENAFIQTILDNPRDDTTLLVYADWLEEQEDPVSIAKSEFLRLTVEIEDSTTIKERETRGKRLQQLAASLDTDWLSMVSRMPVENCHKDEILTDSHPWDHPQFTVACHRTWQGLEATDHRLVRYCHECRKNVYYCDTIQEARTNAWEGRCVAIDLGVIRRERDLEPRRMMLGRIGEDWFRQEEERMKLDPVSAERERRKEESRRKLAEKQPGPPGLI